MECLQSIQVFIQLHPEKKATNINKNHDYWLIIGVNFSLGSIILTGSTSFKTEKENYLTDYEQKLCVTYN